ncbi:metallophosphoesterase family protein [Sabulicella glaciei]|uniref:metallophosphoesterase family protein n=1 Tax=Sabulicella glaciei TaxID=2984948 RepID=UPI0034A068C9
MRLHVLSDLHCEFGGFEPPALKADVTLLAGDTYTKGRLCPWDDAEATFGRPVVAVCGNHEFYHGKIEPLCEPGHWLDCVDNDRFINQSDDRNTHHCTFARNGLSSGAEITSDYNAFCERLFPNQSKVAPALTAARRGRWPRLMIITSTPVDRASPGRRALPCEVQQLRQT